MKEKILTFLKTKLTGVQEAYLNGIAETYSKTITKEEDIETVFSANTLELIKLSAGHLQVEGDRRATEAQKTALKNFLEKHGLNEDGTPKTKEPKKDKDPDPEAPAWFKSFQAKVEQDTIKLNEKLAAMETEKTQTVLMTKTAAKVKEKGIPESFFKVVSGNLKIESEDKIDQLVAKIEGDYTTFRQEMAEQGVVISIPPKSAGGENKEGEATGKSVADKRNTQKSEGVTGKKI